MAKSFKILFALAAMILFVLLAGTVASAEANRTGSIKGNGVNLRTEPAISSKVLTQLSDGTKVKVLDAENGWYKIFYNDFTGWVSDRFVTVRDEAIGEGTIKGSNVNIRSKPDLDAAVIATLDKGAKVPVYAHSGGWYKIQLQEDRYGWVSDDFLAVSRSSNSRGLQNDVTVPAVSKEDTGKGQDKDLRQQIVAYAKKFLGVKYVYGGITPKGFDCSGFVYYVFKHFGINLERTAADQGSHGTKVSRDDLKPGDLVFFDTNGGHNAIGHAGIYIGGGSFIQASSGRSSHKVVISSLNEGFYDDCYMTARRYIGN